MILIHYGATEYKPELVKPIKNRLFVKPHGGLWTSPVDSKWGWKDWCESENYSNPREENSFRIELRPEAKILIIDSLSDLKKLPMVESGLRSFPLYPDYERLALGYDAIHLTEKGQADTNLSYPLSLYGWDCESVLIFTPTVINELVYNQ